MDSAGREGKRLSDQTGHHRMVVMARQQGVGQRTQAHQAAAHRALRQEERNDATWHDKVGHRRTAAIEEGWRIGHPLRISMSIARRYLSLDRWWAGPPKVAIAGVAGATSAG